MDRESTLTSIINFFWSFINIDTPYQVCPFRSTHAWDVVRNNRIIEKFLKSDCDIMVKMDIDQEYPKNYFTKLVPLVEKYKVVGPVIKDRHKENDFIPLAFVFHEGEKVYAFDVSDKTGVCEVPFAHTNLFYSREVLEAIEKPWYEANLSEDGLWRKNHVDFTFLDKIKKAGYPIYIDFSIVVGHQYVSYAY